MDIYLLQGSGTELYPLLLKERLEGRRFFVLRHISETDKEKEASMDFLRSVSKDLDVQIFLIDNYRRFEDFKHALYANVSGVCLPFQEKESPQAKEAMGRFGDSAFFFYTSEEELLLRISEMEKKEREERLASFDFTSLKTDNAGLLPVITRDYRTKEVLMLAYMSRETLEATLQNLVMCYYSRSRKSFWRKGDTSGHYQWLKSLRIDCDNDTLLAEVTSMGPACHTGEESCFFTDLLLPPKERETEDEHPFAVLQRDFDVIEERRKHPKEGSYTNYLFEKGLDKILKKLGEEAVEMVIASKNSDPRELVYETADFLYNTMVLLSLKGLTWEDVMEELKRREMDT